MSAPNLIFGVVMLILIVVLLCQFPQSQAQPSQQRDPFAEMDKQREQEAQSLVDEAARQRSEAALERANTLNDLDAYTLALQVWRGDIDKGLFNIKHRDALIKAARKFYRHVPK